ncbi:hypothetical protein AOT82_2330 [Psychrobacter sp. AntiMn-1]|nr:hypothetical protein AOT82_2330 [Psychrobacter sp. AntiMn-1]
MNQRDKWCFDSNLIVVINAQIFNCQKIITRFLFLDSHKNR